MTGEPAPSRRAQRSLTGGERVAAAGTSTLATPPEPRPAGREIGGLRRFAALDGIRGLAVVAVLLYHAGVSWMGGGLLGVDVFFVLSGFLITSLLCRELSQSTTVRLGRFWAQRARRLLPALLILLLGVAAYAFAYRDSIDVGAVRGDALATLFYVANWHFIFSDQGYFVQAAAPSPLLHTWSLAVEEQYYLVWPVVALVVVRRWGSRALAVVAGAGAASSALLMASLFAAGFSVDRLYYGTDTRAQALLVGSVLGAIGTHTGEAFSIVPGRWKTGRRNRLLLTTLGLCGAGYLGWAWHALSGQSPFLYRGGFLLVALAAGAVIVSCVTLRGSILAGVLSVRPLVFVGRISYGLYLYHWPLFLVINHAHTGLTGAGLLAVRLLVTLAVATASFVFVEEPVRSGRAFRGHLGLGLAGVGAVIAAAAILLATVAPAAEAVATTRGTGLTAAEHAALVSSGAFTTRPVPFLIVGDSVALTLGVGLYQKARTRYGIHLYDGGTLGCDFDTVPVRLSGVVGPATPGCKNWRSQWKTDVDRFHPDVVGLLIGRWEVSDHLYQGRWVHIGDPIWDRHLTTELNQAVDILSADGAKVVFFTMPYVDPPVEAADGSPFPENAPSRMTAFNRLLVSVADSRRNIVTVIDLNKLVDPDAHYQPVVDGVTVRSTDGVHLTKVGGEWLQPDILPTVDTLALEARSTMVRP
jgi:peptidoglycan/LPS O-acetylase OafA/YrhL